MRAPRHHTVIALLVLPLLVGGCSGQAPTPAGSPKPSQLPSQSPTQVTVSPSVEPSAFPTAVFARLGEGPVPESEAAELQAALAGAAGTWGVTATVMSPSGTWTGAAGRADPRHRMRPNAQMAIGSITKTIIAAQVMQLVEAGSLGLDDPAADHLPAELDFDSNDATIENLLSMRSGIPDYVDALYDGLSTDTRHVWTVDEMLALVPRRRTPAGSEFDYSSTNYLLLGLILEHATSRSVAQTLRDGVLHGPGLARMVYQPAERPTAPMAAPDAQPALPIRQGGGYLPSLAGATAAGPAGGIASDSATLARWWARLCSGDIVSQTSLETMTGAHPAEEEYGLGINDWSAADGPGAVGNEGLHVGFEAFAECLPRKGAVVVVLINDDQADLTAVRNAVISAIPLR